MDDQGSLLTRKGQAAMQKGFLLATLLAVFPASGLAWAQTTFPPLPPRDSGLNATELKSSLLGIHLYGITTDVGMKWDECIEPSGKTLYTTPGGEMQGRLTISPKGLACFAYEDTDFKEPQCFVVRRTTRGFSLISEFGGEAFVTTKVVRGIRTCEKQDLIG
jgi:hypothetical protein